jgi:hypothetical protein
MPLRSPLATVVALAVVALSGCDSNSSNSALRDLDGSYAVSQLIFIPDAAALDTVDVGARLNTSVTRLEIFGEDGQVLFRNRFNDASASRLTELTATASRGRATFTAATVEDEAELDDLFLPRVFTLLYNSDNPRGLTGELRLLNVDLEAFDPDLYAGLEPVDGTLELSLSRTTGD